MYDGHAGSQHFSGCKVFWLGGVPWMVAFLLFIIARIPIPWRRDVCTGILKNSSIVLDDVDLVHCSECFCYSCSSFFFSMMKPYCNTSSGRFHLTCHNNVTQCDSM